MGPAVMGVVRGHPRTFAALGLGVAVFLLLPGSLELRTRAIIAWDVTAATLLAGLAQLFWTHGPHEIADVADQQEEGQWTLFFVMLGATVASVAALLIEFSGLHDAPAGQRTLRVALVAATLVLSWLVAHAVFALRYAHDWYDRDGAGQLRRGLMFPGDDPPGYADFLYFSMVLGMTFQVSDVQIATSRLRMLALLHGLLSFLFNTVIVALTVNIAAGLL